jgi:hypothetical protein
VRRALVIALLAAMVAAPAAHAASSPEQQLADKYAPVVGLKKQSKPCSTDGEPYRPVPVETIFGKRDVRLLDDNGDIVKTAPTAADLYRHPGVDMHVDLPGDPLDPGCTYEEWARRMSAGEATTAYAHVVTEPGKPDKLALQYWFYYVFNDWNNKHESDWEMVQLMFDAPDAATALKRRPTEIGYSQHSGAEKADWGDSKLSKRGNHPIVYPGRASHANYFSQSLWLGHGAAEGFGCDDTRTPTTLEQTHVILLPDKPSGADDPFAWLGYQGHWGQKERGPNNGPDGPNMKTQWTKPVTWATDDWRSSSASVPLEKTLGTSTTSFFCGAVAAGSKVYIRFLRNPLFVSAVIAAIVAFAVWLSRRTRWSPARPFPIDEPRTAGEIYRAGFRIYRRYWKLLLGIGLVFVPLSVVAAIVQAALVDFTGFGGLMDVVSEDPVAATILALGIGQLETIVASIVVTAAVAIALQRIGDGEHPDAVDAYRGVTPHGWALAWAWFRVLVVAGLLTASIVGIPFAIIYLVRKTVLTQACVVEDLDADRALRRSSALVRWDGLRVFAIAALVNVTAFLAGPAVGLGFLFLTSSSLGAVNVISSLVYVLVVPYAAVAIALLYYDLRQRKSGAVSLSSPS